MHNLLRTFLVTFSHTRMAVFLISALMFALQLLQTRIFSVIYWNHLVYFIITMALLGLAAGGTVLSLSSRIQSADERPFYAFCLTGFSYSALTGLYVITRLSSDSFHFWNGSGNLLTLVFSYLLSMLPFFFFGLMIAYAFSRHPLHSGTIYFENLLGSAVGCLLYLFLLKPLGAVHLLLLIFIAGSMAGILLRPNKILPVVSLELLGIILISAWTAYTMQIVPEVNKRFWSIPNRVVEFSQWNAISRVDVLSEKGNDHLKTMLIDGDAICQLIHVGDPKRGTPGLSPHREASYVLSRDRKLHNVLVIGAGGGADVLMAYRHHASLVDAVEINPTSAHVVANDYSYFIGDIFKSKDVNLHVEDGRSFVRRSDKQYDIIMLFGVDSFSALSSGAYVMSESYLYTLDAVSDYWAHLVPEGIIQISRWHYPEAPRETLRAFTTAYEALSRHGVDPSRHLLVIADSSGDLPFADILISRRPFLEKDIVALTDWLKGRAEADNWLGQPTRSYLIYNPLLADKSQVDTGLQVNPYYSFVAASRKGKAKRFLEDYQFNVTPVTDDNPFFFQYGRWSHLLKPYTLGPGRFESIQGRWPFLVLLALTLQSVLLVILLVWLPAFKWKRAPGHKIQMPVIVYFGLLGFAFIFVEMALIQKVVLLLGHPIYSMALTIPTLLISAGAGAVCSNYVGMRRTTVTVLLSATGIALLIVAWLFAGPSVVHALLPCSRMTRILAVIALIAPPGVLMGVLFPIGIRRLSRVPRMIPIAWAANGGTSVIGSIGAVIVAMAGGFSSVLAVAAVSYIMVAVSFFVWQAQGQDKALCDRLASTTPTA